MVNGRAIDHRRDGSMAQDKRISRRELLRSVGIAGATIWASPIHTTLRASASRSTNPHKLCRGVPGICEWTGIQCGTCNGDVGDGSWCMNYFDQDGSLAPGTVCVEDWFCEGLQACSKHTDCPRGYACATLNGCTGCGPESGVCLKKCRMGLGRAPIAHTPKRRLGPGRTAADR